MDKTNVRLSRRSFICWIGIFLIFLILPIILITNLNPFYFSRFENYGVYHEFENLSIDQSTVNIKFSEVTGYIQLTKSSIDTDFFSYEDQLHLKDVRAIVIILYTTLILSLTMVLTRRRVLKANLRALSRLSTYYVMIIVPLLIIINLYFDFFFEIAHRIVFRNEYWLLDPKTSNLIKMFPQNIFYEICLIVFIINILLHGIFIFIVISKHEKLGRK